MLDNLLFLFTLKPIIFGFIGMVISGLSFPLAGVIIVRNGLIPMRYMLMHGVILGGIFSIALNLPLVPVVMILNLVLVAAMVLLNKSHTSLSAASTAMMVFTMGLASLLGQVFDVPAKDTLEILWGSPFALVKGDLFILASLAVIVTAYVVVCFKPISMLFFDHDIARSSGVNVGFHNTLMLLITALIISVAMKLLGALLIDALVVLPVLGASKNVKSLKSMFVRSSVTGLVLSVLGYLIALVTNLPVSGVLAILAAAAYLINLAIAKIKTNN
ncbi:MAG: metal ABC transporter permease [Spirochaetales bacterium]